METILDTKYLDCRWDKEKELMIIKFKLASEHITSEEMKKDVVSRVKMIEEYSPTYFIYNQIDNRYVYKVGEQKWVTQQITNAFIRVGLKKLAICVSSELMSELSTRQVVDEAHDIPYTHQVEYFSTEDEAIKWLGI